MARRPDGTLLYECAQCGDDTPSMALLCDKCTKEKYPLFKDYLAKLIADGKLTEEEACLGLMSMNCRGLQGHG